MVFDPPKFHENGSTHYFPGVDPGPASSEHLCRFETFYRGGGARHRRVSEMRRDGARPHWWIRILSLSPDPHVHLSYLDGDEVETVIRSPTIKLKEVLRTLLRREMYSHPPHR